MSKKLLILVVLLLASIPVFAQTVDTAWVRRYNGPANQSDEPTAIAVDGSGNVYVTGNSWGSGTGWDYATIKYYPNGDTAWVRRYNSGSDSNDVARAIAVDGSGNVYITGSSFASGGGGRSNCTTIKYYPNGDAAWVRRYNGAEDIYNSTFDIAIDASGNVYVTGYSAQNGTVSDCTTIKYYSNGDTAWVRRYNATGNSANVGYAIAVDVFGNVYVCGQSNGNGWGFDYLTIKYYPNGDTAWVRGYNGPGNGTDVAHAICIDGSGNVYVTGSSWGSAGNYDYATIKYDPVGNELWFRRYSHPSNWRNDEAKGIAVDVHGNVYVTGYEETSSSTGYATIKYYPNGDTAWVRKYYVAGGWSVASSIALDDNCNVYVTGKSWGIGECDYATLKYDCYGNELWITRYNGAANLDDQATAIAVDKFYNIYVTGKSAASGTTGNWLYDYATIKYVQNNCPVLCVPKYYQYDPVWASDIYDHAGGVWKPKDKTIKRWGCALTSAVMILRYYGVNTGPDGLTPTNPKNLNTWLINNNGYSKYGNVNFAAVRRYSNGKVKYLGSSKTKAQLDEDLKNNRPVVLNVSAYKGHFLVATGQSDCSHYDINDPLSDKRTKLSDSPYNNTWLDIRRFQPSGTQTSSTGALLGTIFTDTSFAISTCSNVELLLIDSLGRRVGFDPIGDSVVEEILNSSYYIENLGPDSTDVDSTTISDTIPTPQAKVIFVDIPSQGNYTLSMVGKDSGSYSMTFELYPSVEIPVVSTRTGSIDSGAVSNIPFRYETKICLSKPGDANSDAKVTVSDVVYLVNYLFKGGRAPSSLCSGDPNSDSNLTVSDVVYLVNYLFKGGPAPLKSNECCL